MTVAADLGNLRHPPVNRRPAPSAEVIICGRVFVIERSNLDSALLWAINGAIVSIWLYGAAHAFSVHDQLKGALSLAIPPYGLYMAWEKSFGHRPDKTELKAALLRPIVNEWCYRQSLTNNRKDNLDEEQKEIFCSCVAEMFVEVVPPDLRLDSQRSEQDSRHIQTILNRIGGSCLSSARYL